MIPSKAERQRKKHICFKSQEYHHHHHHDRHCHDDHPGKVGGTDSGQQSAWDCIAPAFALDDDDDNDGKDDDDRTMMMTEMEKRADTADISVLFLDALASLELDMPLTGVANFSWDIVNRA